MAGGRRAHQRVPGRPRLPARRRRPPVRDGPRRHRQVDAAHQPARDGHRGDGGAGAHGAGRCQRRRPDHPLLLRLPAAADPRPTTSAAAATVGSCGASNSWSSTRCRWCAPTSMWAIDQSLRVNRGRPREAFGGVRLALFGDLHQLPPVVNDAEVAEHLEFLLRRAVLLLGPRAQRGLGHGAGRAHPRLPPARRGPARRAQQSARGRRRRGRPRAPQHARASDPHAGGGRALRDPHANQCRRRPHQHGLPQRAPGRARTPTRPRPPANSTSRRSRPRGR